MEKRLMWFDKQRWQQIQEQRHLRLGAQLEHRAITGSTNDDALSLARSGAPNGMVVIADDQRLGRGRRGSSWLSGPGQGLTFSVVLRDSWRTEHLGVLPLVIGLGVREVVAQRVSASVLVKWPNDVLANNCKVGGILLESLTQGNSIRAVVAGVGLNVRALDLPEELSGVATSLALLGASELAFEPLLADLLDAFERRLCELSNDGFERQWGELNQVDALKGCHVRVDDHVGIASGIEKDGALCLMDAGIKRSVYAGHVVSIAHGE